MRDFLVSCCPAVMWAVTGFHLLFLVLFFRACRRSRDPLFLLPGLITLGLFYDALILSLGTVLPAGALLAGLSRLRYISHGALIPLIFPICAYALHWGKKLRTAVFVLTGALMALGIAEGCVTVLELREIAGVCRYATADATAAWAQTVSQGLSFGTVLPLMAAGIAVWIKQKTPTLFLSGFLMFVFSALGPATGNTDLIFFISMFGEVCMVLFFWLYARRTHKRAA